MKPGANSGLRKPFPKELNLRLIFTLRPDFSEVCQQAGNSDRSVSLEAVTKDHQAVADFAASRTSHQSRIRFKCYAALENGVHCGPYILILT